MAINSRYQVSGPPMPMHDEAGEAESPAMDAMEGPMDDESVHAAKPRRPHRRRIAMADIHKQYRKGRK